MFVPVVHSVPAARTLANPWTPDQAVEGAAVPLRPARLGHRGDQAVASPTPRHHPRGSSPPAGAQVRVASDLVSPPEQERPSPGAPDLPGGGRAGRRDSHRLLSHRLLPPERSPGTVPATSPRARSTNTPHAMPLARLRPASGSRGGPSDRVEASLLGAASVALTAPEPAGTPEPTAEARNPPHSGSSIRSTHEARTSTNAVSTPPPPRSSHSPISGQSRVSRRR